MKQEGASDVIDCANDAFGFAVLLGGVGAGKTHVYAVSGRKIMERSIVKFLAIVAAGE